MICNHPSPLTISAAFKFHQSLFLSRLICLKRGESNGTSFTSDLLILASSVLPKCLSHPFTIILHRGYMHPFTIILHHGYMHPFTIILHHGYMHPFTIILHHGYMHPFTIILHHGYTCMPKVLRDCTFVPGLMNHKDTSNSIIIFYSTSV